MNDPYSGNHSTNTANPRRATAAPSRSLSNMNPATLNDQERAELFLGMPPILPQGSSFVQSARRRNTTAMRSPSSRPRPGKSSPGPSTGSRLGVSALASSESASRLALPGPDTIDITRRALLSSMGHNDLPNTADQLRVLNAEREALQQRLQADSRAAAMNADREEMRRRLEAETRTLKAQKDALELQLQMKELRSMRSVLQSGQWAQRSRVEALPSQGSRVLTIGTDQVAATSLTPDDLDEMRMVRSMMQQGTGAVRSNFEAASPVERISRQQPQQRPTNCNPKEPVASQKKRAFPSQGVKGATAAVASNKKARQTFLVEELKQRETSKFTPIAPLPAVELRRENKKSPSVGASVTKRRPGRPIGSCLHRKNNRIPALPSSLAPFHELPEFQPKGQTIASSRKPAVSTFRLPSAAFWVRPLSRRGSRNPSFPLPKLQVLGTLLNASSSIEDHASKSQELPAYTAPSIKSALKSYQECWDAIEASLNISSKFGLQFTPEVRQQRLLNRFLRDVESDRISIVRDESITGVYGVNSANEVQKRMAAKGFLVGSAAPTENAKKSVNSLAPSRQHELHPESKDRGGFLVPLQMYPLEQHISYPRTA